MSELELTQISFCRGCGLALPRDWESKRETLGLCACFRLMGDPTVFHCFNLFHVYKAVIIIECCRLCIAKFHHHVSHQISFIRSWCTPFRFINFNVSKGGVPTHTNELTPLPLTYLGASSGRRASLVKRKKKETESSLCWRCGDLAVDRWLSARANRGSVFASIVQLGLPL